jgi:tetratricopeptide (TPR) repeat protein
MSRRTRRDSSPAPDGPEGIDREAAARLLRDAHRVLGDDSDDADDAVEWAFSALPDSLGARRLKIEMLLRQGNLEAADTLIAQGLLQRPTNASLSCLRARSLFAQEKLALAGRELRLVLSRRPRHRGALELAGRVARGLGDSKRAVHFLERAERRRPDDEIKSLLAEAWLDCGRPGMARKVLRRMAAPTAMLRSRVLRADGRLLEARETLERAAADTAADDHAEVTAQLIELLEETSDLQRLRRILESVDTDQPAVLARAGMAWLSMGAFHTAAVRMAQLARIRGHRADALVVLMVAASLIKRPRLANRALERLRHIAEPVDRETVAEAWGRGLLGRLLLDQCSARRAGSDPHTGRLHELLREASGVFEEALGQEGPLPKRHRRHLQRHLSVCRQVATQFDDDAADSSAPYSVAGARRTA